MRIGILGSYGEFNKFSGEGVKRYSYELYNNLNNKSINKIANIIKLETNLPLGIIPSFLIENSFRKFSDFDIIHSTGQRIFFPLNKGKCKIMVTAHDFRPLLDPIWRIEVGNGIKNKIYSELGVMGMHQSLKFDYISADSMQTKDEAVRLGFNRNNISVVNLGVDRRYFSRASKHIKKQKFVVGYVGSFAIHKNVKFLVNSVKHMNKNIIFNLWGNKNQEFNNLNKLSLKYQNIKFMGFAPENKIVQIYDSFDVFVFPSLYEGFGLPILEAQARGLPVIIYKRGRISNEVRKYCFEAEDEAHMAQIIESLKENGYNKKLKRKATEYARSFTWEKCAKETLQIYQKLIR